MKKEPSISLSCGHAVTGSMRVHVFMRTPGGKKQRRQAMSPGVEICDACMDVLLHHHGLAFAPLRKALKRVHARVKEQPAA